MSLELVIGIITYLGVAAGAVSGVLEARRKDLDIVGASAVALVTALGGGTLRDLLIGRVPVFWIREEVFAILALAVALVTFYSTRLLRVSARSITIPDALGLGVFTILGVEYGLQAHTSAFIASLMGVITGVFGGVLRDVICNELPSVFTRDTYLYATCSLAGAWVYIGLLQFGASNVAALALPVAVAVVFGLRMAAVRFNISLPEPRQPLGKL